MIPVRPDDRCERCGANLALVGRVHRCVPRAAAVVPTPAKPKPKPALVGSPSKGNWTDAKPFDRGAYYRAYQRDYMRKRRADAKLAADVASGAMAETPSAKRNTKPLTSQMPLGGRRRGVLRRRR